MPTITYNDMQFTIEPRGGGYDLACTRPDGSKAIAGTGLFAGLTQAEADLRALALIKTIFPVGIRSVGPDVTHPSTIGDLRIIGPDVTHPNFIYWNKDSVSCPKDL